MAYYFIFFILTLLIIAISEFLLKNKYKKLGFLVGFLGICFISWFFGARKETVGTDITVYMKPYVDYTKTYGLAWLFNNSNVEFLYGLLVGLTCLIDGELSTLLFLTSFIISLNVFIFAYHMRREVSITAVFMTYLFIVSGYSLNIARQSIAMSFVLLSTIFIRKRRLISFLICVIAGCLFHITAGVGLILYPLYVLLGEKHRVIVYALTIVAAASLILFYNQLIQIMGLLNYKYANGGLDKYKYASLDINNTMTIFNIFCFIMFSYVYYCTKKSKNYKNDRFVNLAYASLIIYVIFFEFGSIIQFIERISYYFLFISFLYFIPKIPKCVKVSENIKGNTFIGSLISIGFCFGYFIFIFYIMGYSSIIPFEFA